MFGQYLWPLKLETAGLRVVWWLCGMFKLASQTGSSAAVITCAETNSAFQRWFVWCWINSLLSDVTVTRHMGLEDGPSRCHRESSQIWVENRHEVITKYLMTSEVCQSKGYMKSFKLVKLNKKQNQMESMNVHVKKWFLPFRFRNYYLWSLFDPKSG